MAMTARERLAERWGNVIAVGLLTSALAVTPLRAQRSETAGITVFAAASLKTTLDHVAADYHNSTGTKVTISYAASPALAKQIEQAAPADIFISADLDWMDYLAQRGLVRSDSRINLLGNRLVLVAPAASSTVLKIAKDFPLATSLGSGKIAVADVKAVPAGKYAKAALEKLGVWAAVEPKLAQAENVRAALALVAREEAALGIVYRTDAMAEPKVRIVDIFPLDTHAAIVYPLAITRAAANVDGARAFVMFLSSREARARFAKDGFTMLE
jgi:molybdate transport system substrate-binding protein